MEQLEEKNSVFQALIVPITDKIPLADKGVVYTSRT